MDTTGDGQANLVVPKMQPMMMNPMMAAGPVDAQQAAAAAAMQAAFRGQQVHAQMAGQGMPVMNPMMAQQMMMQQQMAMQQQQQQQ